MRYRILTSSFGALCSEIPPFGWNVPVFWYLRLRCGCRGNIICWYFFSQTFFVLGNFYLLGHFFPLRQIFFSRAYLRLRCGCSVAMASDGSLHNLTLPPASRKVTPFPLKTFSLLMQQDKNRSGVSGAMEPENLWESLRYHLKFFWSAFGV